MRIRFAITHVATSPDLKGLRVLTLGNCGPRCHYDSKLEAETALETYREGLKRVIGDAVSTLKVLEVECWDHGEAKRSVFDDESELCTIT